MLRLMLGWLAGARHGFTFSLGKYGDALAPYLPGGFWERYQRTYPRWDHEEIWEALLNAWSLFSDASAAAAEKLGLPCDRTLDRRVVAFLQEGQPFVARLAPEESWNSELSRQIAKHGGPPLPFTKTEGR